LPTNPIPQYTIAIAGGLARAVIGHSGSDTDIPAFLRVLARSCAENGIRKLLLVVVGRGIREYAMDSDALYDGVVVMFQAGLPRRAKLAVVAEELNTRRVYQTLAMAAAHLGVRHDVECSVFADEMGAAAWLRQELPPGNRATDERATS
jgi:hypothetical protein